MLWHATSAETPAATPCPEHFTSDVMSLRLTKADNKHCAKSPWRRPASVGNVRSLTHGDARQKLATPMRKMEPQDPFFAPATVAQCCVICICPAAIAPSRPLHLTPALAAYKVRGGRIGPPVAKGPRPLETPMPAALPDARATVKKRAALPRARFPAAQHHSATLHYGQCAEALTPASAQCHRAFLFISGFPFFSDSSPLALSYVAYVGPTPETMSRVPSEDYSPAHSPPTLRRWRVSAHGI